MSRSRARQIHCETAVPCVVQCVECNTSVLKHKWQARWQPSPSNALTKLRQRTPTKRSAERRPRRQFERSKSMWRRASPQTPLARGACFARLASLPRKIFSFRNSYTSKSLKFPRASLWFAPRLCRRTGKTRVTPFQSECSLLNRELTGDLDKESSRRRYANRASVQLPISY